MLRKSTKSTYCGGNSMGGRRERNPHTHSDVIFSNFLFFVISDTQNTAIYFTKELYYILCIIYIYYIQEEIMEIWKLKTN